MTAKKGFRRKAKVYNIVWDEGDLAGLSVRVGGLPVGRLLDMAEIAAEVPDDFAGSMASVKPLLTEFAGALIEWNLEDDDGNPVPTDLGGVCGQDLSLVIPVVMRWMSALSEVAPPLSEPSNSGGTSQEAQLQLATSSESLAS